MIAKKPLDKKSESGPKIMTVEDQKRGKEGGMRRLSGSVRTLGVNRSRQRRQMSRRPMTSTRFPRRGENMGRREVDSVDMSGPMEAVEGVLDLSSEGHAFLRPKFVPAGAIDVYVSSSRVRRFRLREGDWVVGQGRKPRESERYFSLLKVEKVNGVPVEKIGERKNFFDLTPVYPEPQIKLETDPNILSTRMIDLLCPIGYGQRGLIVSPPKSGKTWLLKEIAQGVAVNHPKIKIIAVLVGERPEEVTDIRRFVKGEVVASNFDEKPGQQTRAAEIAISRARRLVEQGDDVFIIFDSITRLARAYNLSVPSSGRILSGGFDPAALYPAKKFFGSARNIEGGGSLTIIGTALVDTGSKMDDLIYEEFKGTGNMELHLDRKLSEQRIYPAFDVLRSSTRKDDLLLSADDWNKVTTLRRMLNLLEKEEKTSTLIERLGKSKNNAEFLKNLKNGG